LILDVRHMMPNILKGRYIRDAVLDQRGAALMIVLIVLVGLTVLGAAGLTMTNVEIRHSENVEASTEAFYAADAGLQQYLGSSANGGSPDTFTVGTSTVIVPPTLVSNLLGGQPMYRLRSVATHTAGPGVLTSRAVGALAIYVTSTGTPVTVTAALASGSGLHKNGNAGTISGYDNADASDPYCTEGPGAPVAGVAVPPDGYDQNGNNPVPEGNPDIDDAQSAEDLLNATTIDWESLSQNPGADYTVPPDDWPDFSSLPADDWPVIFVDGDVSLEADQDGRGTIIVTGDITLNGNFEWDGLLLVGGNMTSNGYNQIEGAAIMGLNILLGESVAESDIGNGNKLFQFNSCYVKLASEQIGANSSNTGLALVPGSWSEEI
jgi:PilX N-terminal